MTRPARLAHWTNATDLGRPAERPQWHLRPDLAPPPSGFRVVVDTREQAPYFGGMSWASRGTLQTGDYSLQGYEHRIVVERKSLQDAFGSYGRGRDRFEREYGRLASIESSAILIEGTYADVLDPERRDHPRELLAGVLKTLQRERHPEAQRVLHVLHEIGWWGPRPEWWSAVRPQSVEGSLLSWAHRYGVAVLLGGSRRLSERLCFRWLATWWLEHHHEGDTL